MSLKAFHMVFIIASITVSFLFSLWCFTNTQYSNLPLAFGGIAAGASLSIYFVYFLKKLARI